MFFHFPPGFMSTLSRKISIRISAAINLFLDYFTMLRVPVPLLPRQHKPATSEDVPNTLCPGQGTAPWNHLRPTACREDARLLISCWSR